MVKKLQALKAKKGFTLVELIVVIAIIGVLAAILVPVMMGQVTKAKINSLDSTAKTVVTTVNTWIADRYTNGQSGDVDGAWTFTKGGTVTSATDGVAAKTSSWGIGTPANDSTHGETGLSHALNDAYNFANDDHIKFWIEKGKCVAAVYKQGGAVASGVSYTVSTGAWDGITLKDKKDGIVNEDVSDGDGAGPMVGTYPKLKGTST